MTAQEFQTRLLPLGQSMYAMAMSVLHHPDSAKEVVQECYSKLWERRNQLDYIENLKAYVLTMVRNTALLQLRSSIRWEDLTEEKVNEIEDEVADTERMALEEKALALVAHQPEEVKEILRLRFTEGLSTEAIAGKVGKTAENVRAILSRRLRQMREELKNNPL